MTRRRGATSLVGLVALAVFSLGCSDGGDGVAAGTDPTTTPSTTESSTTTSAAIGTSGQDPDRASDSGGCPVPVSSRPAAAGPFAVGRTTMSVVDDTRATEPLPDAPTPPSPVRTLPMVVLYPASGGPGEPGAIVDGAPAAEGEFPLVVYSHGVASNGAERNPALARWARAGYVVVAPTFPLSSRPSTDISDLPNQPADVVVVTEGFLDAVGSPDHRLNGRVLPECLALAGHSLGGATTLAVAFDPCCGDLDPRAVIDVAGVLLPITPGATLEETDPLPTLIVHGALDDVVPVEQSEIAFAQLDGPRWFLTFPAGQHSSMFEPGEVDVFSAAVVAFLDAHLKGSPAGLEQLPALAESSGIATLRLAAGGDDGGA